ncbi:hypothetical protein NMY22_g12310 [Coprinellus aureogranulatus]|nr:hypothetical protein NMY22_g12310 [Coprinellus aureogranulatus]
MGRAVSASSQLASKPLPLALPLIPGTKPKSLFLSFTAISTASPPHSVSRAPLVPVILRSSYFDTGDDAHPDIAYSRPRARSVALSDRALDRGGLAMREVWTGHCEAVERSSNMCGCSGVRSTVGEDVIRFRQEAG